MVLALSHHCTGVPSLRIPNTFTPSPADGRSRYVQPFAIINRAAVESLVFVCGTYADLGQEAGSPHSARMCVNEIQVGIFSPRHPGQEPGFLLKGSQGSG